MINDSIEFYSDPEVKAWWDEFQKDENAEKIFLPSIPFNYHEIVRELIRREYVRQD